ncbi:MAG: DUF2142 domain-containing protein [Synechococcaceae bacterium WB9_2_170]|nr:DUF2142 domain-containing protein [Synechococcaceae bacterium WB9_2_170]
MKAFWVGGLRSGCRWLKWLLGAIVVLVVCQFLVSQRIIFPFDAPDERVHFARAYDIANAPWLVRQFRQDARVAVGAYFYDPQPINDCYGKPDCIKSPSSASLSSLPLSGFFASVYRQGFAGSDNSFPYSGGNYLHLVPALKLSGLLRFDVFTAYRVARWSAGLVYCLTAFVLVLYVYRYRGMPFDAFFASLLLLVFALPSSVFLANSVSGDFLITAASVLLALLHIDACPGLVFARPWAVRLQPLLHLIMLAKLPYLPLVIASNGVALVRFKEARRPFYIFSNLVVIGYVLWWYWRSHAAVDALFKSQRGNWAGSRLTIAQLSEFVWGATSTGLSQAADLYRQFVAVLGNGPIARIFYPESFAAFHLGIVCAILVFVALAVYRSGIPVQFLNSCRSSILSLWVSAVIATYYLICYSLRLYWASDYPLDGLQGRYFLPVAPFLVVCLKEFLKGSIIVSSGFQSRRPSSASLAGFNLAVNAVLGLVVVQYVFYLKNLFAYYGSAI